MKTSEVKIILEKIYGWKNPKIKPLVGYETLNFRIESNEKLCVLKISPYSEQSLSEFAGENQILDSLQSLDCNYPEPIIGLSGSNIEIWENKYIVRALSYLNGDFIAEVQHNKKLITSFGKIIAELNLATRNLYIPSIKSKSIIWDLSNTHFSSDQLQNVQNQKKRTLIDYFLLQFDLYVKSVIHKLPQQIIHNDANDWNVLCHEDQVTGIIDFGDTVYSTRISEIAVAISYIIANEEDPISKANVFLEAYHHIYPISELELELLYYFIAARICISLISSATARKENPENDYISISEEGFWKLLHKWITINPIYAKNRFLASCNYLPKSNQNLEHQLLARKNFIPDVYSISYTKPIHMDAAALQYMYDTDGNTFLDAYNNIPHVGHEHPTIVRTAQKQIAKLNTNTRYVFDSLQEYSEKLLSKFPSSLNKVFLVNSGSAASDLAIRLARNYTNCNKLIVMQHGYHGNTQQGIAISHYKYDSKGGKGKNEEIIEAPLPNSYLDSFENNPNTTGERYAENLIKVIEEQENIAAFIAEPISGCGGQVPLAKNYLAQLYPYLKSQNILRISDEVQTGFGRLGNYFWGFEMHDVSPDIVILGKPIGNGHPMAAVVTTEEIADAFNNGMEFFSSFGGNPVSCKIGHSVLEIIEKEKLQEQAKLSGDYFLNRMKVIKDQFNVIGDVRGQGLFLGIEIVIPAKEYLPNPELAGKIKNELRTKNILVSTDGPHDNVIKMKPPLCFTPNNMDEVIDALLTILKSKSL